MRHWIFLILVAICGCTKVQPNPPAWAAAIDERYLVIADDVEVTIGGGREVIAPPGSATAGSKWIEHAVVYTNKSNCPIWVVGYSETFPFSRIETRANEAAAWRNYGVYYCGTGARDIEIAPNASHSFTAALPERYVGQEFRVLIRYDRKRGGQQRLIAASEAHRLDRPAAG